MGMDSGGFGDELYCFCLFVGPSLFAFCYACRYVSVIDFTVNLPCTAFHCTACAAVPPASHQAETALPTPARRAQTPLQLHCDSPLAPAAVGRCGRGRGWRSADLAGVSVRSGPRVGRGGLTPRNHPRLAHVTAR